MKPLTLTAILLIMGLFTFAQKEVWKSGGPTEYTSEELSLEFITGSGERFSFPAPKEAGAALAALIPTAIDAGIKIVTNALEKNAKKFATQYVFRNSNLDIGKGQVLDFTVTRTVTIGKNKPVAFKATFKAHKLDGIQGFVYYIDAIELNYAGAKTRSQEAMDYTFEIKVTFYNEKNEKVTQEISPLSLTSIPFSSTSFATSPYKHRTDIIPLINKGKLAEISVNVVETNPRKVKAERILALWNEHKDEVKEVIKVVLPEEKKKDEGTTPAPDPKKTTDSGGTVVDPNKPVSSGGN